MMSKLPHPAAAAAAVAAGPGGALLAAELAELLGELLLGCAERADLLRRLPEDRVELNQRIELCGMRVGG